MLDWLTFDSTTYVSVSTTQSPKLCNLLLRDSNRSWFLPLTKSRRISFPWHMTREAVAAQGSFFSLFGRWSGIWQVRKPTRCAPRCASICLGQRSSCFSYPSACGWRCSNSHVGGASIQPDIYSQAKPLPWGGQSSRKGKISKRCHVGFLPWLCLHSSFRYVSRIYSVVSPRALIYKQSPLSSLALDCSWGCLCSLLPFTQLNVYRKTLMATFFFLLPLVGPC